MGASAKLTVNGSNDQINADATDQIWVNASGDSIHAGYNDKLFDNRSSTLVKIDSSIGTLAISGFGTDTTGIVDLLNGVGGYTSASQA